MKLLILSVEEQPETERLEEEARKLGFNVQVSAPSGVSAKELRGITHLLIRTIQGEAAAAKKLAQEALQLGVVVVDEKLALGGGRNKYRNYLLFRKHGLFVPKTILLNKKNLARTADFEGEKVVVKSASGKRGRDIHLVEKKALPKFFAGLKKGAKYIAQEFVEIRKEFRVLIVGEKVLGAFSKQTNDWRHNVSLGARAVREELTPEISRTALKAKRIAGSEIAGVDIALTGKGLFVLEVNRSPGFSAFERATGINAAKEMLLYIMQKKSNAA